VFTTLFGEDKLSKHEYAKLLISIAFSRTPICLRREPDLRYQISFRLYNTDNDSKVHLYNVPGIYIISRLKFDEEEFLYAGSTGRSISNRLYRWTKELEGKSRKDENHPAAKKARKDGVKSTDNIVARYITKAEVESITDSFYHHWFDEMDEFIAYILNCRYNTEKREF
jgi:hypothetical protein